MTRDDAWVRFAVAAVHINCDEVVAAAYADRLLAEYDKRWDARVPYQGARLSLEGFVGTNPDLRGNEK